MIGYAGHAWTNLQGIECTQVKEVDRVVETTTKIKSYGVSFVHHAMIV